LHGSASPPPSPVSQPAFKFKRFGVQFQLQSFCCSFFFSVADFFARTKSFIDIDYGKPSELLLYVVKARRHGLVVRDKTQVREVMGWNPSPALDTIYHVALIWIKSMKAKIVE